MTAALSRQDCDLLILGGGPAGCALASALHQAGHHGLLLASRAQNVPFRIGESATPDVPSLLHKAGLPADLAAAGHQPHYGTLSLWGGGSLIFNDFLQKGQGSGWHLDRARFDADLQQSVRQRGIPCTDVGHLLSAERTETGRWLLCFDDGQEITARFLADTAGRRAPLATRLGAERRQLDGLVAIATRVPLDPASRLLGASLVEPFAGGWWYAAPLPDGQAIVALMTDQDLAADHHYRDPGQYRALWAQTQALSGYVPPPAGPLSGLASFPAHSSCLSQAAGPGWLAAGDALTGFDPLTSSGIAGALSDALAAAETLGRWLDGEDQAIAGRLYGARANATMTRYWQERQEHYGWEQRWSQAPFWARRVPAAATASGTAAEQPVTPANGGGQNPADP